jgi:hypothetical protein
MIRRIPLSSILSRTLAAGWVLVTLSSCGPHAPSLHPVRGQVTVGGQPASGVIVVFHPVHPIDGMKYPPSAMTGPDGCFDVGTLVANDGAPAGDYQVTMTWFPPEYERRPGEETLPDRLQGRYSDKDKSPLSAQIKPGPNEVSFKLEGQRASR